MARRYQPQPPDTNGTERIIGFFAFWGVVGLLVTTLVVPGAKSLFPPTVSFSYSHYIATGERKCVKVEPETAGSCSELPDKYSTQWVK
ncbi:MAG: hypothetical protein JRJ45_00305 [Deltaproteobacteria bacterium]|nr:hypothetical protein [Deltaproteobacteria bacterium]